jgi:acetyltransferase-like isoleucine patch superfamily enzyme
MALGVVRRGAYRLLAFSQRLGWQIRARLFLSALGSCGEGVTIGAGFDITDPRNVFLGSDVYLGPRVCILATDARVVIGNKIMFGPDVTLVTGDHDMSQFGRYMFDVHDKRPGTDADIIIEDDVWIGSRAVVLKGVILRRGTVVGAGSVVTRSTRPYSVVTGTPAVHRRYRIAPEQIAAHERAIAGEEA